jgi:ligand-binding sensor domain-containing protein
MFSQSPHWIDYTNGKQIFSLSEDNNGIWVGTNGGLVMINKATDQPVFYNQGNSGLLYNSITSVAVDKNANKWIAGNRGLSEFNGTNWTVFDTSNSAIPDVTVDYVFADNSGSIWAGTFSGGLGKFDGSKWTKVGIPGLSNNITAIAQDKNGNLWVGAANGVAKNNGSWTVYNTSNSGLPGDVITSIVFDSLDNAWIGTNFGLAKFDGTKWTAFTPQSSGLSGEFVEALSIDSQNNIWIGTYDNGLSKFDGTNWTNYNSSNSGLPDDEVYAVHVDVAGTKWVGTMNGLATFDGSTWTNINTSNSGLPNGNYNTPLVTGPIHIDSKNNKWIGGTYLVKFDGTTWTQFDPATTVYSYSPTNVTSVTTDNSGIPWVLSLSNLLSLDLNHWNEINSGSSTLSGLTGFTSIASDNSSNIWLGSKSGLAKFDGTNWSVFTTSNSSIPSNSIYSLATEGNVIWLTTSAGLVKYDGSNWNLYNPANQTYAFYNLTIDAAGNSWMSYTGGLAKFDGSAWKFFVVPDSASISSIAAAGSSVWIGTNNGLFSFDGTNWTAFNIYNSGLTNNLIRSVAADKQNNIWLATGNDDVLEFNPGGIVSSIKKYISSSPINFELYQNYPNPFNPSTIISYQIQKDGIVSLKIFDVLGREVKTLVNEYKKQGTYTVSFDAGGLSGGSSSKGDLASSIYFYQLRSNGFVSTKKMLLLK